MIRLLTGYDEALAALEEELSALGAGDRVTLRSYLIEPGESTERLLAALGAALERGASASVTLDGTLASALSRFWERTATRWDAVRALAERFPDRASAMRLRVTDHSKYAIFERATGERTALLGGMNLGDRFRPWRDFALRVQGDAVVALRAAIAGEAAARARGIELVANALAPARRFEVRGAFERLLADPSLEWFRVAMAYVDRAGTELLDRALARGARVELVVPSRANVYQHSNMRSLAALLRARPSLSLLGSRSMLHAKALLAGDARGPRVAFLGSANLKRNSLDKFGELNALVTDEGFLADFGKALDALAAESDPIARPSYRLIAALVEESFG